MTPINFHKKEKPLTSLLSMGGGAAGMQFGGGAAEEAKYIDEVFSNYLYAGNSTTLSVNSGVDNTRGGMIWFKVRPDTERHMLFDTERGTSNYVQSNSQVSATGGGSALTSFNNDGYTLGASAYQNNSGKDYFSWNFRKQKGFFDIVTWTGNGADPRQISHNLECVPGFVMIKCTSDDHDWACYHRDWTGKLLVLNSSSIANSGIWKNTTATDTYITVAASNSVNGDGKTYVGYFFAGGESTAATASSIDYSGAGRTYTTSSSSDFSFGTGDFTIECWSRHHTNYNNGVFQLSTSNGGLSTGGSNTLATAYNGSCWHSYGANTTFNSPNMVVSQGSWHHVAMVRHNSVLKLYIDGNQVSSIADTVNYTCTYINIGGYYTTSFLLNGDISNFRVVKGTAVYTSSFKPPTQPLTNISGTVLLCNNDSTNNEGSTITPAALTTANGDAKTDSPFDDPEGFKFGENEDQNLIKCGSYIGHNSDFPEINVGWEPAWIMIKRTDSGDNWVVWDSMRGIATDGNDNAILPDTPYAESSSAYLDLTSTGWKFTRQSGMVNNTGSTYSYVAIRRPDGYVGKPAEAGTDRFTMIMGNGSGTTGPNFISGWPVDFGMQRNPAGAQSWDTAARLLGTNYQQTNDITHDGTGAGYTWDYNNGWTHTYGTTSQQSWMWKRGQGFDVVCYTGNNNSQGRPIPHSLNNTPEMIWVKARNYSQGPFMAGHIGQNGGSSPWDYYMRVNTTDVNNNADWVWKDTPPTSTHFTVANDSWMNTTYHYVAYLFASSNDVNGNPISKCGYYAGNGSARTITTGFQPRFLIIKSSSNAVHWYVLDSLRGWTVGNTGADNYLRLNANTAQSQWDFGAPTTTGFTLPDGDGAFNATGVDYIYYAHA